MKPGSVGHARRDPAGCARWLAAADGLWIVTALVVRHDPEITVFEVVFVPPPDLPGYPDEQIRVTVRGAGGVYAVPVDADGRSWQHRYPRTPLSKLPADYRLPWETLLGALCLWYPRDPAHLRWRPHQGLDAFLRIVQRHLWCEEYVRRHGTPWPIEDAPHGERADGRPHPILNPELREAS